MSAIKSFKAAARAEEEPSIPFEITDEESKKVYKLTSTKPSTGQLALVAATDFEDEDDQQHVLQVLFSFVRGTLGESGFRTIERLLAKKIIDIDGLVEIIEWLVEEWSGFPTQPSSDSPPTPPASGKRSTGRVRSTGLTPSPSNHPASTASSSDGPENT